MYINTSTLEYPISEQQIRSLYPNTSFATPFVAPEPFALVFETIMPAYDPITQNVRETAPVYYGNQWNQTWEVYALTPEQIATNEESMRQQNKAQAESLLQATDWTATIDIADPQYSDPYLGNQPDFLAYRSAVRKIAVNPPITIEVWPTKPSEEWIGVTPQALSEAVSQEAAAV